MQQAFSKTEPRRRGACPTLDAPMRTGDGLLARIRVAGGRVTPGQLRALAELAQEHGNGLVEVTARGNVQVRGLSESSAPQFADAVWEILPIAMGLVVDVSPIAGEDPTELADARPFAEAIRLGVAQFEDRLGPKVSVVVDGGGQVSLAGLKADIRLLAVGADRWAVAVGRERPEAMGADEALGVTLKTLEALADLGPEARGADLPSCLNAPHPGPPREGEGAAPVASAGRAATPMRPLPPRGGGWEGGRFALGNKGGHTILVSLPFGAAEAGALIALAEAAETDGVETIRLAPGHTLLLDNASPKLIRDAAALGVITEGADPRRRVSACIGSAGCASGLIPARFLAERFAQDIPDHGHVHFSGCAKGCAHPRVADITLVGHADGIGLVMNGRAGDTPELILDEAGISPALAACRKAR